MTSISPKSNPAGTALPGSMIHPSTVPCRSIGEQTGFTALERADDAIWKVDALLAAKHMEVAHAAGNRDAAVAHRIAMEAAVNKRRALRIAVAERCGACFFDAAGEQDVLEMQGRVAA